MSPTPRFLLLVALAALPAMVALVTPDAMPVVGVVDLAIAVALGVALLRRIPGQALRIERTLAPIQFVRGEASVSLRIESSADRTLFVEVRDLPPPEIEVSGLPLSATIPPLGTIDLSYPVRFGLRGRHRFGDVWVRATDGLGLLRVDSRVAVPTEVRVYPAPLSSGGGPPRITRNTPDAQGSGKTRVPSEGAELEGLRRFVTGDDPRLIDWKATARRGQTIVREMRPERNQRLVLAIDLGRALHASLGAATKLDRVLEAAHELALLGLASGDEVGLLAFGASVRARIAPRRGAAQGRRLLDALLELRSEPVEPLYPEAFAELGTLVQRRALVVLFTDVTDPESSRSVVESLVRLRPRHLPLCITVEDSALRAASRAPSRDVDDSYRKVAARALLGDQERALKMLTARGVLTVHVPAAELAAATLDRYLDIKYRALL